MTTKRLEESEKLLKAQKKLLAAWDLQWRRLRDLCDDTGISKTGFARETGLVLQAAESAKYVLLSEESSRQIADAIPQQSLSSIPEPNPCRPDSLGMCLEHDRSFQICVIEVPP